MRAAHVQRWAAGPEPLRSMVASRRRSWCRRFRRPVTNAMPRGAQARRTFRARRTRPRRTRERGTTTRVGEWKPTERQKTRDTPPRRGVAALMNALELGDLPDSCPADGAYRDQTCINGPVAGYSPPRRPNAPPPIGPRLQPRLRAFQRWRAHRRRGALRPPSVR